MEFKPSWVFRNNHLQTIVPSFLSLPNSLKKTEQIVFVPLHDGDQIQVKLNQNTNTTKAIFLVHGLEGSSDARYMIQVASKLFQEGFSTIRINLRNCGGTEKFSKSLYNAGMSSDLDEVITHFKTYQWNEINLIGFSLGGNLVGKYVGEKSEQIDNSIKKAILISPPLDLYSSIPQMSLGFNRFYDSHFTYLLKAKFKKKCQDHPKQYDIQLLKKVKNLFSFDDTITGPHFGFKDAMAYYHWGSSLQYLKKTIIPVTIIQAKDDPIIDVKICEKFSQDCGELIKIHMTEKGGHVGFYGYGNGCTKASEWLAHSIFQILHS